MGETISETNHLYCRHSPRTQIWFGPQLYLLKTYFLTYLYRVPRDPSLKQNIDFFETMKDIQPCFAAVGMKISTLA